MKNLKLLAIVLIGTLLMFAGCKKDGIRPGDLATETRTTDSFTSIEVSDAISVYITQGDTEQVTVETSRSFLKHIETTVSGGVLHISVDRSFYLLRPHREPDIKVYITMRTLTGINSSGACEISCTGNFETENLRIELSGASKFDCASIDASSVIIDASGASEISLSGTALNMNISSMSGASELKCFALVCEYIYMDLSGASEAVVNVNTGLNVIASGASVIKYIGSPTTIKQDLSGASELIKL
jgi:hypothetical protein